MSSNKAAFSPDPLPLLIKLAPHGNPTLLPLHYRTDANTHKRQRRQVSHGAAMFLHFRKTYCFGLSPYSFGPGVPSRHINTNTMKPPR